MDEERRHDYKEVTNRLGHLEASLAVIEMRVADTTTMKKWVMGQLAVLIIALIGAAAGWGELTQKVEGLDLELIESNAKVAIQVAGQHGLELNQIRERDAIISNEIIQLRNSLSEVRSNVRKRTDDRYRRSDAINDWKAQEHWLEERFKNYDQRIGHLESEHHSGESK